MRKKGGKVAEGGGEINMTPMIDIVFQMIIFFVLTIEMEKQSLNEKIRLAMSPHGPAVEKKDPRTVTVEVDGDGVISVSRVPMSRGTFTAIMKKTVAEYGQTTPVVIRGDGKTKHEAIRGVMDACSEAGLWKVKFAAIKDAVKSR
ncbi:MAG: biopolymer transporter ExbD [Verrucomicrobia bacterium]|nr:biopolymer transporter ExbD [Verrucomicrobiota bacterium]